MDMEKNYIVQVCSHNNFLFELSPIKSWLTNLGHLDMSRSWGCKLSNDISHVALELA
jgi:hypothetical protein